MRTVACTAARLELDEASTPDPGRGQVRIEVLRCGICGSDLHAREHCDELAEVSRRPATRASCAPISAVVFGHEFCGAVAEYGPRMPRKVPAGTPVVALPLLRTPTGIARDRPVARARRAPTPSR